MATKQRSKRSKWIRLAVGISIGPIVILLPFRFDKEAPPDPGVTLTNCSIGAGFTGRC